MLLTYGYTSDGVPLIFGEIISKIPQNLWPLKKSAYGTDGSCDISFTGFVGHIHYNTRSKTICSMLMHLAISETKLVSLN